MKYFDDTCYTDLFFRANQKLLLNANGGITVFNFLIRFCKYRSIMSNNVFAIENVCYVYECMTENTYIIPNNRV